LIDAEPQGDNDLWGARIGRLVGAPVLPDVAIVDSETPDHLYLRPREGVAARDLGAALDAAQRRLPDVDRIEVGGSIVRLYLRRPSTRLQKALGEVMVPGTGPFKMVKKGVLERVRGTGVPQIEFIVEPDPVRALVRLRHFEADILARLPESYWPDQADAPATRRAFAALRLPANRLSYLQWNPKRPTVAEVEIRRALSQALDRDKLARDLHHGLAELAASPIAFDRAAAQQALEGKVLRIVILAAHGGHAKKLIASWKDGLHKSSVDLEPSLAEGPGFDSRLREGSYDVALLERIGGEDPNWPQMVADVLVTPLFLRSEVALVSRALEVQPGAGWLDLAAARWVESGSK
jgi:hypothetical protein